MFPSLVLLSIVKALPKRAKKRRKKTKEEEEKKNEEKWVPSLTF